MSYKTRDQRVADEITADYAPCQKCQKSTLLATLAQYGAQCHPCYEYFCTGGHGVNSLSRADRLALLHNLRSVFQTSHPRGWVARLQARENSGERLSIAQRTMLRAASPMSEEATCQ